MYTCRVGKGVSHSGPDSRPAEGFGTHWTFSPGDQAPISDEIPFLEVSTPSSEFSYLPVKQSGWDWDATFMSSY